LFDGLHIAAGCPCFLDHFPALEQTVYSVVYAAVRNF
jgi:hypothetical protein